MGCSQASMPICNTDTWHNREPSTGKPTASSHSVPATAKTLTTNLKANNKMIDLVSFIWLEQQNTHLKQTEEKRSRTTQIFSFQAVDHTLVSMLSFTLSHTNIEKDVLTCLGFYFFFVFLFQRPHLSTELGRLLLKCTGLQISSHPIQLSVF